MSLQIASPFQQFFDRDGSPLDNGFVYVGTANLNPETNPLTVFFDDALTIPAAQPLRTSNGYIVRNGSPARLFTSQDNFSLTVRDKKEQIVFTVSEATSLSELAASLALGSGSSLVGYNQASTNAVDRTVEGRLRDFAFATDFGASENTLEALLALSLPAMDAGLVIALDGLNVEVAPSVALDHNYVTAGGVKLYDLRGIVDLPQLRQRSYANPIFGDNVGGVDTQIYPGAQNANQGVAWAKVGNQEKIFVAQRPVGPNYAATERIRISEWDVAPDGTTTLVAFSNELNVGHGQDLSVLVIGTSIKLYTSNPTLPGFEFNNAGKGFSEINWRGAATDQSDVVPYQLFGFSGSGHPLAAYRRATVCVSSDGRFLILGATDETFDGINDSAHFAVIYDLEEVKTASNPLDVNPIYVFRLPGKSFAQGGVLQGVHSDGTQIVVWRGFTGAFAHNSIDVFDFQGNLLRSFDVDGSRALYGRDGLLDNPSLGIPVAIEPEGVTMRGSNEIICGFQVVWHAAGDIVTYEGVNFAATANNISGILPADQRRWVRTTKAATAGTWEDDVEAGSFVIGNVYRIATVGTTDFTLIGASSNTVGEVFTATGAGSGDGIATRTYSRGALTRRLKTFYAVGAPLASGADEPLDQAITNRLSGAEFASGNNAVDISWIYGDVFQVQAYDETLGRYLNGFHYGNQDRLRVYDQREGSNNLIYSSLRANYRATRQIGEVRARQGSLALGGAINLYGVDDSVNSGRARLYAAGPFVGSDVFVDLVNAVTPVFRPNASLDGQINLGGAANRWGTVFAATGAIDTSDAREKQDVADITEAEKRVAIAIKGMLKSFRFKDAVALKGDDARIHFGVIAQDVKAAFEAEGLDPTRYALFCWDEWKEQPEIEGEQSYAPAGERYGIRYSELFAFIIAAL